MIGALVAIRVLRMHRVLVGYFEEVAGKRSI
jgi:hypothetical protein